MTQRKDPEPIEPDGFAGKRRVGRPRLSQQEKELRAAALLAKKMAGKTLNQAAKELKMSLTNAKRALSDDIVKSILTNATDYLSGTLLPKAIAVYEQALEDGNIDVATRVLEGAGLVGKQAGVNIQVQTPEIESFEAFRVQLIRKRQEENQQQRIQAEDVPPSEAQLVERVVDGGCDRGESRPTAPPTQVALQRATEGTLSFEEMVARVGRD